MAVRPIPEGYHSVTPYLIVKGAAKAIDFYKKAFGATEIMRFPGPNDTIAHAEIKIGDSPVMLADEGQASGYRAPDVHGGAPVSLMVYVENVDKGEALCSLDPRADFRHSIREFGGVIGTEVLDKGLCLSVCELYSQAAIFANRFS